MSTVNVSVIRSEEKPCCVVCGSEGDVVYEGLTDRLFGVPGAWTLKCCKTVTCRTHWLDPAPVADDLALLYENYYTHEDAAPSNPGGPLRRMLRRVSDQYLSGKFGYPLSGTSFIVRLLARLLILSPARRANLDFSVFYLPAQQAGKLLEIGCGSGSMLHLMKQKGWQVRGLDFDPRAVENARSKGLDVAQGELSAQRYPGGSFDAVVMSHVIEHVPDPRALLSECARVTSPGGQVILITPNIASDLSKKFKNNFRGLEPPRHLNLFTPNSLAQLAIRAGFSSVEISTTIRDIAGLNRASENILKLGCHQMNVRTSSISSRTYDYWIALQQSFKLYLDPSCGGEIVAILKR